VLERGICLSGATCSPPQTHLPHAQLLSPHDPTAQVIGQGMSGNNQRKAAVGFKRLLGLCRARVSRVLVRVRKFIFDEMDNWLPLFKPNHAWRVRWDAFVLFLTLYTATLMPFEIAFVDAYWVANNQLFWQTINITTDVPTSTNSCLRSTIVPATRPDIALGWMRYRRPSSCWTSSCACAPALLRCAVTSAMLPTPLLIMPPTLVPLTRLNATHNAAHPLSTSWLTSPTPFPPPLESRLPCHHATTNVCAHVAAILLTRFPHRRHIYRRTACSCATLIR
jgi:hypothetical protein